MKKIWICILIVCSFSILASCQHDSDIENVTDFGNELWNNGVLEEMYGIDVEIDKDLALKIGDTVLRDYLGEKADNMDLMISFVSNQDFYVVSRMPKYDPKKGTLGGDISVAISSIDGRILKMWPGE